MRRGHEPTGIVAFRREVIDQAALAHSDAQY